MDRLPSAIIQTRFTLERDLSLPVFRTGPGQRYGAHARYMLAVYLSRYVSANLMNATFIGGAGRGGRIDAFRPNDRDLVDVDLPTRLGAPRSNQRDCYLSSLMCLANAGSSVSFFTPRRVL